MSVASGTWVLDDRYDVGDVIGRGAMGEVYRAHDRRLRRDVAIKFLKPQLAAQAEAHARFEQEAHNAARLTHPNVVLVLDSGDHDGVPYLVMECLPGRTLRDEMREEGQLSAARVTWIARDVLAGLAAAHDIGIVHRDASPANILLTDTGRAKIADFGIAKAIENPSVTVVGQVLGTPAYVAPERLMGESASPASDVYGVGAILYEALAGVAPFTGDSPVAVAHQAVSARPERLEHLRPDVPLDLVAAIDHAMDPDPTRRPTADALRAALAGDDALTDETGTVPIVDLAADEPQTMAMGAIDAAGPMATMALPARSPAVRPRHTARQRKALIATVLVAAAVGVLLLLASNGSPSHTSATSDTTVPSTVATTAPPPTTIATVQARTQVSPVRVRRPAKHHGKG